MDVFLNGVLLKAGTDYNTNTANTIAGLTATVANDEVTVLVYDIFTTADMVSATSGGTFSGAVTFGSTVSGLDVNGTEIILDADADTSITADTDDQIDIRISGADDFQLTANTFTALSGSTIATDTISETTSGSGVTIDSVLLKDGGIDVNGNEIILDADADSSITADTDDQIDIKVGGTDTVVVTPDVLEVKGSHPDLKLLDSDDNNYGGLFYNDGTLTLGSDHGGQHSSSKARISVDGTARVTIDDGGDVDIETGDIFFSTAGKGINLGVTSNTDSNTLDDYEEGTFTPTLSYQNTSGLTLSYDNQTGYYTKIGRMVHVYISIQADISGSLVNDNLSFTGLPFSISTSQGSTGATVMITNATGSGADKVYTLQPQSTYLYISNAQGNGNMADDVGTGSNVLFQTATWYFVG
jgi:hypothetical protein